MLLSGIRVLCISTTLQVLAAPESWSKYLYRQKVTVKLYYQLIIEMFVQQLYQGWGEAIQE